MSWTILTEHTLTSIYKKWQTTNNNSMTALAIRQAQNSFFFLSFEYDRFSIYQTQEKQYKMCKIIISIAHDGVLRHGFISFQFISFQFI